MFFSSGTSSLIKQPITKLYIIYITILPQNLRANEFGLPDQHLKIKNGVWQYDLGSRPKLELASSLQIILNVIYHLSGRSYFAGLLK
jgi:hypothetical protein